MRLTTLLFIRWIIASIILGIITFVRYVKGYYDWMDWAMWFIIVLFLTSLYFVDLDISTINDGTTITVH